MLQPKMKAPSPGPVARRGFTRTMWMVSVLFIAIATWCCVAAELEREEWLRILKNESSNTLKCGRKSYCSRLVFDDIEFNASCHCDSECTSFRDCCVDRAVSDSEAVQGGTVRGVAIERWGCGLFAYTFAGVKTPQYASMVNSCPEGHRLSSLCGRQPGSSGRYSYLLDVAVLSARTDSWYQNLYCAACNNESHLTPYKPSVACSFDNVNMHTMMEQAGYVEGNLTWVFPNGSVCSLQLTLNSTGVKDVGWIRSCPDGIIGECPVGTTEPSLAEKCRSYALFSLDKEKDEQNKTYKNPHCALCHGVQPKCRPMFQGRTMLPGPSLTYILDINWERSSPEVSWNCTLPHGLWDVLHGRCIRLDAICSEGQKFDGAACIPVEPGGAEESCVKITLIQHEYRILQEGSIVLNSTLFPLYENHVFKEGQFEHLPNGSVAICRSLMEEVHDTLVFYSSAAQVYITIICMSISIVCLVLHIATYCLLPKLCNLPGKNLVALSWALLLAQLLLLVGIRPIVDVPHGLCVFIAVAIQYFFLAAFCWMNIMSLDIWRTFSSSLGHANSSRTYRKYSAYAWGLPGLLVAVTFTADIAGSGIVSPHLASSRNTCWFGSRVGQAVFLTIPIVIILVVNAVLFGITVYKLHQHTHDNYLYIRKKNKEELSATLSRSSANYPSSSPPTGAQKLPSTRGGVAGSREEARLYLYIKLFIVMGMSWIFGFLATLANISVLMYPFLVLNGMQGAFIFFMFDIKRSIGRMLWERVVGRHHAAPAFLDSKGSGTNNNSSSNQSVGKKKISQTSTSSSFLSSGAFRPVSSLKREPEVVGPRVLSLPPSDETMELMDNRTSGTALLPQHPVPGGHRPTGGGLHPEHWLHKLPVSEVT